MASTPLPPATHDALFRLLFGPSALPEDVVRWHHQGLSFANPTPATPPFVLAQSSGGPCGVLTALQGYLLHVLLHAASGEPAAAPGLEPWRLPLAATLYSNPRRVKTPPPTLEAMAALPAPFFTTALVHAVAWLIWQSRPSPTAPARLVLAAHPESLRDAPLPPGAPAESYVTVSFPDFSSLEACIAGAGAPQLHSDSGVLLVVLSLLLTRGVDVITGDMDEPSPLVGRFGACTQELLNLALTGMARSNTFDGTQSLKDEAGNPVCILRGLTDRPIVGYLSHAEAMRFSAVGGLYKLPLSPIWVLGGEAHFTVLLGMDWNLNLETPLERAKRLFEKFDTEGSKFIELQALDGLITELGGVPATDPHARATLHARLDGEGVILWPAFWREVGPMLGCGSPPPPHAASANSPLELALTAAHAAFEAADLSGGGGFIDSSALPGVLAAGAAALTPKPSPAVVEALQAEFVGMDIVLWEELAAKIRAALGGEVGPVMPPLLPAKPAPPKPQPLFDLSAFGIKPTPAKKARHRSVSTEAVTMEMEGADEPVPGLGLLADAAKGATTGPSAAAPAPSTITPTGGTTPFFHFNGLQDSGGRQPRCTPLSVKLGADGDALNNGMSADAALTAAMGLLLLLRPPAPATTESSPRTARFGGGGGGGGGGAAVLRGAAAAAAVTAAAVAAAAFLETIAIVSSTSRGSLPPSKRMALVRPSSAISIRSPPRRRTPEGAVTARPLTATGSLPSERRKTPPPEEAGATESSACLRETSRRGSTRSHLESLGDETCARERGRRRGRRSEKGKDDVEREKNLEKKTLSSPSLSHLPSTTTSLVIT